MSHILSYIHYTPPRTTHPAPHTHTHTHTHTPPHHKGEGDSTTPPSHQRGEGDSTTPPPHHRGQRATVLWLTHDHGCGGGWNAGPYIYIYICMIFIYSLWCIWLNNPITNITKCLCPIICYFYLLLFNDHQCCREDSLGLMGRARSRVSARSRVLWGAEYTGKMVELVT